MAMKKTMLTLVATAVALGLMTAPARADNKQDREGFNKRIHQINDAVEKRNLMESALKHISVETGVPLSDVESMHKRHKDMGAAGLLVACVLADETKKPAEDFMQQREKGKEWSAIARDNQVGFDKLSARLDRLEGAFLKGNTAKVDEKKRKK